MARPAQGFVRCRKTRGTSLFGVHHDFGWPVVGARAVAGFTLHSCQRTRSGRVTAKTSRQVFFGRENAGRGGVRGRHPRHVSGPMAELAILGPDETGALAAKRSHPHGKNQVPPHQTVDYHEASRPIKVRSECEFPRAKTGTPFAYEM